MRNPNFKDPDMEIGYIGKIFGANIYTDEKDVERINLILEFLKKKEKEAAEKEIEQMLSKYTRS